MAKRILVTRKWPAAVEERLARDYDAVLNTDDTPMGADEIAAAMDEYDAVCPTVSDKVPASSFRSDQRARIVGSYGVGFDHVDVAAAKAAGVTVTNTPGCLDDCTADLAMTLILMTARRAAEGERQARSGEWTGWRPTHMMGTKVTGKTLGVVGMGRIGQAVARRARHGFGMKIAYFDAFDVPAKALEGLDAERCESVEALLERADIATLHIPGGADNHHLIDADKLRALGRDGILVNTARGEVVHQDDLIAALEDGTIRAAGLDVFEGEPAIPERLRTLDRVVMLPHLGSATTETRVAMGMMVADNLDAFFDGREPPNRVG